MIYYLTINDVEQIYLLEALKRLHYDNVTDLNAIYNSSTEEAYSKEDVLGLISKEDILYRQLKRKLEGGM